MSGTGGPAGGAGPAAPRDTGPGGVQGTGTGAVADEIRHILAAATGRAEMLRIPAGAPLFGDTVGLDSLTGTLLLREIQLRFGVDVAAEDLNLDSLATLGTLAAFVADRLG